MMIHSARAQRGNSPSDAEILMAVMASQEAGKITNAMAAIIMALAAREARQSNWRNYSFRDDMEAEAMTAMCMAVPLIDMKRSGANPGAYLAFTCRNAFIAVLKRERNYRATEQAMRREYGMPCSLSEIIDHEQSLRPEQERLPLAPAPKRKKASSNGRSLQPAQQP